MKRFILSSVVGLLLCVLTTSANDNWDYSPYGELPIEITRSMQLADKYINEIKYDKALEQCLTTLEMAQSTLKEDHIVIPSCYLSIGSLYAVKKDYKTAIEYYQRALILLMNIPHSELKLSEAYQQIAAIYEETGADDLAVEYKQKAADIISNLTENEEQYRATQFALALQYIACNRLNEAEELLIQLEPEFVRVYGAESLSTATLYLALGQACSSQFAKSLNYTERALSILLPHFPKEHETLAHCYANLGVIYNDFYNDAPKAIEYYKRALSYYSKNKNQDATPIAMAYSGLANAYIKQANYNSAESFLRKALNILDNQSEGQAPCLPTIYTTLANVNLLQNKIQLAEDYLQKGISFSKQYYGEHNPSIYMAFAAIGTTYLNNLNNTEKSIKYYQKALEEMSYLGGEDYNMACLVYAGIAEIYARKGNWDYALQYADKILEIESSLSKESTLYVGIAYFVYALDAMQRQDWASVRKNIQKTINTLTAIGGENHPYTIQCHQIIQILDAQGLY